MPRRTALFAGRNPSVLRSRNTRAKCAPVATEETKGTFRGNALPSTLVVSHVASCRGRRSRLALARQKNREHDRSDENSKPLLSGFRTCRQSSSEHTLRPHKPICCGERCRLHGETTFPLVALLLYRTESSGSRDYPKREFGMVARFASECGSTGLNRRYCSA